MARTVFEVVHSVASDYKGTSSMRAREAFKRFLAFLGGILSGSYPGASGFEVAQTQATGTITLSSASGNLTATINGVATGNVAFATSDANTASLLAAAINALSSALVTNHITAAASGAVVTVTAKHPGHPGNAITLACSGTGATASGARLTGGTSTTYTL
jgi:hypothetical protein